MLICTQTNCRFCRIDYTGNFWCTNEQPVLRINSTVTHPNVLQCVTYKKRTGPMPIDPRDSTGLYPGQIRPPEEDVEDEEVPCDT